MGSLFRFKKFKSRGHGLIARMCNLLDKHSEILESFDSSGGVTIRRNASGGITIGGKGASGGSGPLPGSSMQIASAIVESDSEVIITIRGGMWTHRYTAIEFSPLDIIEETLNLPYGEGAETVTSLWVYAKLYDVGGVNTAGWGTSVEYPVSTGAELRRPIGRVSVSDGVAFFTNCNAGDIFTW